MTIPVGIWLGSLLDLEVSLWHELVRVLEVFGVVMDGPEVSEDGSSRGDEVAVVVVVLDVGVGCPAHNSYWSPSQGLLDDGGTVGKVWLIAPSGRPISAHDAVELLLRLCRDFRKARHGEYKAHERGRRSIAASTKEGTSGISNFAFRELASVLIELIPEVLREGRRGVALVHASPHVSYKAEEKLG